MNKIKYLIFVPTLFSLFACGNKRLPKRKDGNTCNITLVSNYDKITLDCPEVVPMDKDLEIHLNIPYCDCPNDTTWKEEPTADKEGVLKTPNLEYIVNIGDINIFIGGEEFNESFIYYGETKGNGLLTISHEYVINDIEIRIDAKARERLFLFGLDFGPSIEERRIKGDTTNEGGDIEVKFEANYQNKKYPIQTLTGGEAFPVFEDDDVEITFNSLRPLPDKIWLRYNSRYAIEGLQFTCKYESNTKCIFKIPHYVINDHLSVLQYGEK
ncbi:MAG: hypothetical protein MJ214_01945 [Bacilli bacterium]|nr:hypothetical protein [Bacilli bacterium]